MLAVNIPDQAKPLFELLALMPEEDFDAIRNALNAAPPNLRPEKFSAEVKNILPGVNRIVDLVEAIVGLSRSPRDSSVTIDELVNAVAEAVITRRKAQQPPIDQAVLVHRLVTLLGINSVKLYARASNVQHQYEDVFLSARIISDIRTVFESHDTKPLGAMVVHNLKITSLHGEHTQNKFFALDNLDLELLQQCIDRAREKTKSLETIIEESRLTYFPSK
jgi:hypothetical protein